MEKGANMRKCANARTNYDYMIERLLKNNKFKEEITENHINKNMDSNEIEEAYYKYCL